MIVRSATKYRHHAETTSQVRTKRIRYCKGELASRACITIFPNLSIGKMFVVFCCDDCIREFVIFLLICTDKRQQMEEFRHPFIVFCIKGAISGQNAEKTGSGHGNSQWHHQTTSVWAENRLLKSTDFGLFLREIA